MKNNNYNGGGIGLMGLIILFYNFNGNYDLYDLICKALMTVGG